MRKQIDFHNVLDIERIKRFEVYLMGNGETVLDRRYPNMTQERPEINSVTVRGQGYTISAFFTLYRTEPPHASVVNIGIAADSEDTLDEIETEIKEIFYIG